jgi:hypothetical protein
MKTISHSEAAELLEQVGVIYAPGESAKVEKTIKISGVISAGIPTEKIATCNTLSLEMLGEILAACGVTREVGIAHGIAVILGERSPSEAGKKWAQEIKELAACKLPKVPVAGRRTGTLAIEEIS